MKETEDRSEDFLILKEELRKKLEETGVPLDEWGKGEAKELEDLIGEVVEGTINLSFDNEKQKWIRVVKPVEVHVFYEFPEGDVYFLREDRQVFKDGRERRRNHFWIGEKMEKEEIPFEASVRAIKEELGLTPPFASGPRHFGDKRIRRESKSFPGLISRHSVSCFEVCLTQEQFNPEGYVEEQEDKTTFFVWEEMEATYPYSCQG